MNNPLSGALPGKVSTDDDTQISPCDGQEACDKENLENCSNLDPEEEYFFCVSEDKKDLLRVTEFCPGDDDNPYVQIFCEGGAAVFYEAYFVHDKEGGKKHLIKLNQHDSWHLLPEPVTLSHFPIHVVKKVCSLLGSGVFDDPNMLQMDELEFEGSQFYSPRLRNDKPVQITGFDDNDMFKGGNHSSPIMFDLLNKRVYLSVNVDGYVYWCEAADKALEKLEEIRELLTSKHLVLQDEDQQDSLPKAFPPEGKSFETTEFFALIKEGEDLFSIPVVEWENGQWVDGRHNNYLDAFKRQRSGEIDRSATWRVDKNMRPYLYVVKKDRRLQVAAMIAVAILVALVVVMLLVKQGQSTAKPSESPTPTATPSPKKETKPSPSPSTKPDPLDRIHLVKIVDQRCSIEQSEGHPLVKIFAELEGAPTVKKDDLILKPTWDNDHNEVELVKVEKDHHDGQDFLVLSVSISPHLQARFKEHGLHFTFTQE